MRLMEIIRKEVIKDSYELAEIGELFFDQPELPEDKHLQEMPLEIPLIYILTQGVPEDYNPPDIINVGYAGERSLSHIAILKSFHQKRFEDEIMIRISDITKERTKEPYDLINIINPPFNNSRIGDLYRVSIGALSSEGLLTTISSEKQIGLMQNVTSQLIDSNRAVGGENCYFQQRLDCCKSVGYYFTPLWKK